jgi:hypothetical protein
MADDLWGFESHEFEQEKNDMPEYILKEQINLLGKKTNNLLYGRTQVFNVKTENIDYEFATIFDVTVPRLDNYSKTLFILYSNAESIYPVAISVGKSYGEDYENFRPEYICNDKAEFETAISNILSSQQVVKIIQALYTKARTV